MYYRCSFVGFAGGIFTPDIAFDSIVKGLINKMKEPSLRCVDLVINELTQNVKRSAVEVSTTNYQAWGHAFFAPRLIMTLFRLPNLYVSHLSEITQ